MNRHLLRCILITSVAALIFIPFIGDCPLFDWDEVNFAECAREMLVSGDYSHVQLNYRPFWEKPPVFIWMQALSMNFFGVNEFAARFPNAICSIVTLLAIYIAGKKFHSPKFGLTWTLLYSATLLPHFYFRSGIIDPWFNFFIFISICNAFSFLNNPGGKREFVQSIIAGVCLGLAVLTKGPVALLLAGLSVAGYLLWTRQLKLLWHPKTLLFYFVTLAVSGSWFLVEWMKGNGNVVLEFIDYQVRLFKTEDAGHSGPFFYHVLILLAGCFPASVIFISTYMKYSTLTPYQRGVRKIMICLFWVVLIIFSVVKTKIVHYSSLCYFPLTMVAAMGVCSDFGAQGLSRFTRILYWILSVVLTVAFFAIVFIEKYKHVLLDKHLLNDPVAEQSLEINAHWHGFEFIVPLLLLAGCITLYHGINRQKQALIYWSLGIFFAFISTAIFAVIPRIQEYTQQTAIEFYKERSKELCYVETHNFKSYAYLFYSGRKPSDYSNPDQLQYIEKQMDLMEREGKSRIKSFSVANVLWMEHGKIDRPAYIVIKTPEEETLSKVHNARKLFSKGGYSFFVRTPE